MSKLTDAERTIIFNALTTAAHQYEKDATTAYELAMHGLAIKASAEALGASCNSKSPMPSNCATNSSFYGTTSNIKRKTGRRNGARPETGTPVRSRPRRDFLVPSKNDATHRRS